jgi:hypothetical protein
MAKGNATFSGAKNQTSGLLFKRTPSGPALDVVSWHFKAPYRIWIHSRLIEESYKPIAVEVQWVGNKHVSISETEMAMRIELASVRSGAESRTELDPSTFREIALGRVLEQHAAILSAHWISLQGAKQDKVALVKQYEVKEAGNQIPRAGRITEELGAGKRDSLFIAAIYAQQVDAGSTKPALQTANLLNTNVSLVYVAVKTARKHGWLTATGSGKGGGALTPLGRRELKGADFMSRYETYMNTNVRGSK